MPRRLRGRTSGKRANFCDEIFPRLHSQTSQSQKKTYLQRPVASYQHRRRSNSPMDPTLAVKAVQCPQQLCGAAADGGQREGPLGAGHRPAISNLKRGNSARAQRRSRLPCWKTTGTENAGDLDEMPKSAPHPPPRGVQHISPPAFISPPPRLPFVQKILRSGGKQTLTFWAVPDNSQVVPDPLDRWGGVRRSRGEGIPHQTPSPHRPWGGTEKNANPTYFCIYAVCYWDVTGSFPQIRQTDYANA